ncbi:hypothetical protein EDB84DRAFT_1565734 [Lactarius hengduanensis]|nr:hypothetical protein EDB84DRAFT_1565734 [Lactarius hengduanensis]
MSAPRYNLSEDEDDDLFGDNPGSDGDDNDNTMRPPTSSRVNRRPPSSLSDSTGVSYSKFSQQRAHPSGALPKPSSISPDLLAALTHDELYHNQQYRKTHEKVANLEHTVSEMVCEIVELRRTCKGIALSTTPVVNDTVPDPERLVFPSPQPPSLVRPQHLPQSVLWTSEDAKNDPLVGIKKSNQSRAPNGSGHPSLKRNWHLEIPMDVDPTDPRSIDQPRKKRYFKTFFPNEWNAAVTELEAAAPLLTLCADHWKAESTLGAVLRDRHLPSRPPSPHSPPPQQSRLSPRRRLKAASPSVPRARSPTQRPNKKAKHDGQKGKETSGTGTGVSGGLPPASPPSTPAFLAMARAAAPSQQPRARPRANFKDIIVCPSASNLIDVITNDFPTVPDAADLLRAMHDATDCETRKPSNSVTALLDRLDSADPDAPDVDDDDSNENWGHAQFTAGSLTIRSALVDWESVGSTSTAFKLIAATYLADNYLELLFEQLQRCWKDAQSSSASPLAPAPAASGSSDAEPAPSKSKPAPKSKAAPKPKAAPSKPKAAPSKPKAAPSKPKAAPSKSHAAPSNSSGTAPAAPTEPSPTKPSGAKAGPSKLSGTKAGPSKSAKRTEPAASKSSPTEPASKRATLSRAAKAHCGAPMDQDESASQEASSEG